MAPLEQTIGDTITKIITSVRIDRSNAVLLAETRDRYQKGPQAIILQTSRQ